MVQCIVAGWNFAARHVSLRVCLPPCTAIVISTVWLLVKLNVDKWLVANSVKGNFSCLLSNTGLEHFSFLEMSTRARKFATADNRKQLYLISYPV